MRTYFLKLTLFISPIAVVLLFPMFVFWSSGEFISPARAIQIQRTATQEIIYGPAYSDFTKKYKLDAVLAKKPEILVLGTSRVMQFRANFFKNPETFYNAGGGISNIQQLGFFMDRIPATDWPDVIIIGLDPYFFDPTIVDRQNNLPLTNARNTNISETVRNGWWKVYADYWHGKFTLDDVIQRKDDTTIGLRALTENSGFRNDGSEQYPSDSVYQKNDFLEKASAIQNNQNCLDYSSTISLRALEQFSDFSARAAAHGTRVIAFITPYPNRLMTAMSALENDCRMSEKKISDLLQKMSLENRALRYFRMSDISWFGGKEEEMVDPFHGSEMTVIRMLIAMSKQDGAISTLLNPAILTR